MIRRELPPIKRAGGIIAAGLLIAGAVAALFISWEWLLFAALFAALYRAA